MGGLLRYSRSVDFSSLCLLISERAMASNHSSATRGEWAPAGGQLLSFLVKWGFFREALLNYPGSDEVGPACSSHCWNQSWSNHPFKVSFLLTLLYQYNIYKKKGPSKRHRVSLTHFCLIRRGIGTSERPLGMYLFFYILPFKMENTNFKMVKISCIRTLGKASLPSNQGP